MRKKRPDHAGVNGKGEQERLYNAITKLHAKSQPACQCERD